MFYPIERFANQSSIPALGWTYKLGVEMTNSTELGYILDKQISFAKQDVVTNIRLVAVGLMAFVLSSMIVTARITSPPEYRVMFMSTIMSTIMMIIFLVVIAGSATVVIICAASALKSQHTFQELLAAKYAR